jgi:general nucleoside transport system permease protein
MTDFAGMIPAILAGAVHRGTPIAFAALGETVAERSGVLNLGVEGMMLVGAMAAFAVQVETHSLAMAVAAAAMAGAVLASVHAVLVLFARANQVVSGFAVAILGTGLSGFFGRPYVGATIHGRGECDIPWLRDLPIVGEALFRQDLLVYVSVLLAALVWFGLYRTRLGLAVRAVGERPEAAFAQGVHITAMRFGAIIFGGMLAGIGGAYLSIAYTQVWAEKMTAGQGWIAIGLVIVARWSPFGVLAAAWLFGGLLVLHPHLQAAGVTVSPYLIAMLPYLAAIVALVVATRVYRKMGRGMPASLAKENDLP